jgi:alpha-L-fucosidase 2
MSTFNQPFDPQRDIWFTAPAKDWNEALPLGNGKTGAMVFGTFNEKIQLNDATFWAGHPHDYNNPEAHKSLAEIQKLIFAGKENEATAVASKSFMGSPPFQAAYQPIGDLLIESVNAKPVTDFFRSLDVKTGISTVSYNCEGTTYVRESFVSAVDGVLVLRISADKLGAISTRVRLVGPYQSSLTHEGKKLLAQGQWKDDGQKRAWTANWDKPGIKYAASIQPKTSGGTVSEGGASFQVIELSPVDKSLDYHKIKLYVPAGSKTLKKAVLLGKDGIHYTYRIEKFSANPAVSEETFRFYPERYLNIEVIDLRD